VNAPRALVFLLAAGAVACDDDRAERAFGAGAAVTVRGAGATVPRALMSKWFEQYAVVDPTTTLTYDAQGSGAGVRGVIERSSDFGVSDSPLSDAVAASDKDVLHVPLAVEAIAVVYAVQGAPARLQMTEDVLADMLLGHTGWWDDPAIAALNPGVKLPHIPVRIVYRADDSGSSFVLTDWLSRTTKKWSIAATRSLMLPGVGTPVQRDDGMISRLAASDGTLGYLSAVTAATLHLPTFAIRNAAGRFVAPTLEGMRAAAASARLGDDLRADATAAPGELAYPLCSFTFGLIRANGPDPARRRALARFLWWAVHDGQKFAPPLGFGALPGELATRDEDVLRSLRAAGEPAL
jgi:phosphate transport system substrate-binding protein